MFTNSREVHVLYSRTWNEKLRHIKNSPVFIIIIFDIRYSPLEKDSHIAIAFVKFHEGQEQETRTNCNSNLIKVFIFVFLFFKFPVLQ